MSLTRRTLLATIGVLPLFVSACATTGGVAPFESNASFRLMLYG